MTIHCGTLEMGEASSPGYWRTEYSSYANSGVWGAYVYFTNGVSNQYIDIKLNQSSFWCSGKLRLHSTYSYANQSGYSRTFDWAIARNGGNQYHSSFQENTPGGMGVSASHFSVAQWVWTGSYHYMRVSKSSTTGNSAYMQLYIDQNAVSYMHQLTLGSLST